MLADAYINPIIFPTSLSVSFHHQHQRQLQDSTGNQTIFTTSTHHHFSSPPLLLVTTSTHHPFYSPQPQSPQFTSSPNKHSQWPPSPASSSLTLLRTVALATIRMGMRMMRKTSSASMADLATTRTVMTKRTRRRSKKLQLCLPLSLTGRLRPHNTRRASTTLACLSTANHRLHHSLETVSSFGRASSNVAPVYYQPVDGVGGLDF